MSKPIKPTEPRAPVVPTKTYVETWKGSVSVYSESLTKIVSKVKQQVDHWRNARADCVLADPTLDDITIELVHEYGDDYVEAKWDQQVTITRSDSEFAALQVKHSKAMTTYRDNLVIYQDLMVQYEKNLKVYETEKARAVEAREREQLARLAAKYPRG